MDLAECSTSRRIARGEAEPDYISVIPNDLLLQIFMRLPHSLSVIRCSTVCKRWNSLISNLPNHFIRRFIEHHKGEMPPSHTILLFLFDDRLLYRLFSEGSKILHRKMNEWYDSSCYLDFLPWPRVHVCASYKDLLLVTPSFYDPRPLQYCICNSLTRQWVILPLEAHPMQNHPIASHGLACKYKYSDHEDDNSINIRYKVVRLETSSDSLSSVNNGYVLPFTIFCSETGNWSQSTLFASSPWAPRFTHLSHPLGTSNGMLHFPLKLDQSFTGLILTIDPFEDTGTQNLIRCSFIDKPERFISGALSSFSVVNGQLRFLQSKMYDIFVFTLRIWELKYEEDPSRNGPPAMSWQLLYNGELNSTFAPAISVIGVDPDDGDVVYMFTKNGGVYRYKIRAENFDQVGRVPTASLSKGLREHHTIYRRSLTLSHPIWPTAIPRLP